MHGLVYKWVLICSVVFKKNNYQQAQKNKNKTLRNDHLDVWVMSVLFLSLPHVDSTDVQSECSNEGQPAGKKYKRSNSTSTHTSMESEDDRSSHSSVNKGNSSRVMMILPKYGKQQLCGVL